MVGVPGRSKGCRTCRRRKKGCDRAEPSCTQCIAAGLVCGGYARDLVWVNATTEQPEKRREAPVLGPWHVRYAGQPDTDVTIVLRDSLAQTAREIKYLGAFWSAYLPNGRAFSPQAAKLSTGGWTGALARLYDSEPTLRLAALATSASVLGGQVDDTHLKIKGLQTYSLALQEMSIALQDPIRATGDGLLAAVRLMEFYEILFGSDAEQYAEASTHVAGWRGHNDGQLAIVMSRGPKTLRSGAGHQLFADGRLNTMVGALARRKRSPLSSTEWKTIPWEQREKSYKDRLMDIFVDIPGLLEDLDALRAEESPDVVAKLRAKLLMDCRQNHELLTTWETDMGDELFIYDVHFADSSLPIPRSDNDVALLQLTHLYWAVCLLLYSTMGFAMRIPTFPTTPQSSTKAGTQNPTPPPTNTQSPSSAPSSSPMQSQFGPLPPSKPERYPRKNPRMYAAKIAHSVHLFWDPSAGAFGNHVGLFPLGLAMRFLAASESIETCEEYWMMRKLFNRPFLGTFVGRFLSNLQKEAPKQQLRNMHGDTGIQVRAAHWWKEGEQLPIRTAR